MGVRFIDILVSMDSVPPSGVLNGGLQYEDNATDVVFSISPDLHQTISAAGTPAYRIDFNSSAGYDPGTSGNPFEDGSNQVVRSIPYKYTCLGGTMEATLVCTALNKDNTAAVTVLTYPVIIGFTAVKRNTAAVEKVENNLSALERHLGNAVTDVENSISAMETSLRETVTDAENNISAMEVGLREAVTDAVSDIATMQVGLREAVTDAEENISAMETSLRETVTDAENNISATEQRLQESVATVEDKLANGEFDGKDGKDADYNLVCNALKGNASGSGAIRIDDTSPLEHEIAVRLTPYVNANGAKVTRYGKNLLFYNKDTVSTSPTNPSVQFIHNDDGTIIVNGTANETSQYQYDVYVDLPAGDYILSGCPFGGGNNKYLINFAVYYNGVRLKDTWETGTGLEVNAPNGIDKVFVGVRVYQGMTVENLVFKPQLELGTTATAYEPYIEPTTYTADENGNVSVTSVSPTTTLIADNGVSISAEYNRDINNVIAGIITKIGGI